MHISDNYMKQGYKLSNYPPWMERGYEHCILLRVGFDLAI